MINYERLGVKAKNSRRNYILLFGDTMLFINAMTFISVNSVIAYFLSSLGASTLEISLASALVSICAFFSQPIFVKMAMESSYKIKIFTKILFIQRIFFLVFIITIPLLAKRDPHLMVILFLICWGIFNLFTGSYSPMYSSLLAKMVPHRQRGRLLGFAGAAGNLLALGASVIIGILLKDMAFPYNYTVIFLIGIILLILDVVDFIFMKEVPDEVIGKYSGYFEHIKNIPRNLRDNVKVMNIIIGNTFIAISNVAMGYYAIYAIRTYHARAEQIALFTGIGVVANVVGNMSFGFLADRHGHKLILLLAAIFNIVAGIMVIGVHSIFGVFVAFALSTLCSSGFNLSSGVLVIHNSDKDKVPVYTSANSMITMGMYSIIMVISSYIIDRFTFTPVFATISIVGFAAFIVFKFSEIDV